MDLHRDAAAPSGRVQDSRSLRSAPGNPFNPLAISLAWPVRECPFVTVRIRAQILPASLGSVELASRSHRIPVNPEHVQEPLPVGVGRQQRRQHRRAGGHERPPRPPDMKTIRRRKRGHRRSLARALDAERRDRQPAFDQAGVGHRSCSRSTRRRVSELCEAPQSGRQERFVSPTVACRVITRSFVAGSSAVATSLRRLPTHGGRIARSP